MFDSKGRSVTVTRDTTRLRLILGSAQSEVFSKINECIPIDQTSYQEVLIYLYKNE